MKKLGVICIALVLALGSLGMGYAAWTDTLYISGTVTTGSVQWELTEFTIEDSYAPPIAVADLHCRDGFAGPPPRFWPDPEGKNVGWGWGILVDSDGDGDNDTLQLTLENVYPCYFNEIAVYAHNNGTIPLRIQQVIISSDYETHVLDWEPPPPFPVVALDLDGDGLDDFEIWWKNAVGTQMHPCDDSPEMSFWVHVLQDAPQDSSLTFTIQIVAVQWDGYTPPGG